MSKIAIVGNGPSGTGRGKDIDACDFVVRMKCWQSMGPDNAGSKTNAILGWGSRCTEIPKGGDWELWFNIGSVSLKPEPDKEEPGDWRWAMKIAEHHPLYVVRSDTQERLDEFINECVGTGGKCSTAGIKAVAMAVDRNEWDEIHIWGFDAICPVCKSTWRHAKNREFANGAKHTIVGEKITLAVFEDTGKWLGKECDSKLVWHFRPECIPKGMYAEVEEKEEKPKAEETKKDDKPEKTKNNSD